MYYLRFVFLSFFFFFFWNAIPLFDYKKELIIIKKVKKIFLTSREYRHKTKGFFKNRKPFLSLEHWKQHFREKIIKTFYSNTGGYEPQLPQINSY